MTKASVGARVVMRADLAADLGVPTTGEIVEGDSPWYLENDREAVWFHGDGEPENESWAVDAELGVDVSAA